MVRYGIISNMLKEGKFITKKYFSMFSLCVFGSLASALNLMLDMIVGGNILGETALTAITIVAPLITILYFCAYLVTPGYGIMYGKHNGAFETDQAYRTAGQSIVSALALSVLIGLLLLVMKGPYLNYYGCTGELYEQASAYYNWVIAYSLIKPLNNAFYYLVMADGDAAIGTGSKIANIITHIILSIVFCQIFGIAGLGMATCCGSILSILVRLTHFLRKNNSIHFRFCFAPGEFKGALLLSCSIFGSYLFTGLTDIVMNKVILMSCGVSMIAAYSVINLVFFVFEMCDSIYDSGSGLVSTFLGERNNNGINRTMGVAMRTTMGLAVFFAIALFICAPLMPKVYGISTPEIYDAAVGAVRWMALAAIPYCLVSVLINMYPALNKPKLALFMSFLNDFACPLIMAVPFSFMLGFRGVAMGIALAPYLVLAIFVCIVLAKYGKKGFPFYLEDYHEEIVAFDFYIEKSTIVEVRNRIKEEVDRRGLEAKHLELLIEELFTRIYEKNPGNKVMAECSIMFGADYFRIVIRDDGEIFNFVDENNMVESLNSYVLSSLLERYSDKDYNLTTAFNRNGFKFDNEAQEIRF